MKEILTYSNLTLIDFGGAKQFKSSNNEEANTLILTKRYCSPELMFFSQTNPNTKEKYDTFRSDVFSFALIILELGALKMPFEGAAFVSPKIYFNDIYKEAKRLFFEEIEEFYNKTLKSDDKDNFTKLKTTVLDCFNEKRPDFIEIYQKLNESVVDIRENILKEDRCLEDLDIEKLAYDKNLVIRSFKTMMKSDDTRK